jgi:pimeloyl-ACP methyl ester carboxylesterase
VPIAEIDGITTRYEVAGSGPPLLMFSPGGFNAVLENWTDLGHYRGLNLVSRLSERFTCVLFDRRESGQSGGRFERVRWEDYAAQGVGLLDHLDLPEAHVMGGCAGCSVVAAFGVAYPQRTSSMVMFSPAGGPRYRMKQHARFVEHLAYVAQHGPEGVVGLATSTDASFSKDGRVGPWAPVIRSDEAFAKDYAALIADHYDATVSAMARTLFDRDTVPGAEPEDLMSLQIPTLIVPGNDTSHATSAARYLEECLPQVDYWDVPPADQTEANVPDRIVDFLSSV